MDEAERRRIQKEILFSIGLGSKEEAVAKSVSDLTDEEKLKLLTNLMPFEDDGLATMLSIAFEYDLDWLADWVYDKLALRCSVYGWRANQIVTIASEKRKEQAGFGFFRRIFGRGEQKEKRGVEEFE
ncbi:MAG: hypothetical protein QXM86_03635 [Candidatus Bathyarchaeia archaeon]